MILLRPDCLVFKTADGENIPCSAHAVTIELVGESMEWLDKDMILHAAEAVLHYFKAEKCQHIVSVAEFSEALERVLRGLGLDVKTSESLAPVQESADQNLAEAARVFEADLSKLAADSAGGCELLFFPCLRETIHRELELNGKPLVLRFRGLKPCVKRLTGARRWSAHCQVVSDQIVEFLRNCLTAEKAAPNRALVVW
jgi:hypothetical protein